MVYIGRYQIMSTGTGFVDSQPLFIRLMKVLVYFPLRKVPLDDNSLGRISLGQVFMWYLRNATPENFPGPTRNLPCLTFYTITQ